MKASVGTRFQALARPGRLGKGKAGKAGKAGKVKAGRANPVNLSCQSSQSRHGHELSQAKPSHKTSQDITRLKKKTHKNQKTQDRMIGLTGNAEHETY